MSRSCCTKRFRKLCPTVRDTRSAGRNDTDEARGELVKRWTDTGSCCASCATRRSYVCCQTAAGVGRHPRNSKPLDSRILAAVPSLAREATGTLANDELWLYAQGVYNIHMYMCLHT